jgi:hypothetical protein
MSWRDILLVVIGLGVVYLGVDRLLHSQSNTTEIRYFPYIVTQKEFRFHDSIVVHNNNKVIYETEFKKDTTYISGIPDSLLLRELLIRARELSE